MRPRFAYVGCFTSAHRSAQGKGISVFRIDPAGAWSLIETIETAPNPGYIALDPAQRSLYVAHGSHTETSAYARDPQTGRLRFLNKRDTEGDNSSTVEVDSSNRFVLLSTGPGVALYRIEADGSLGERTELIIPPGEIGPWRKEQFGPHPHQATFDPSGRFVIVPDKGLDKVLVYRFDNVNGKLTPCDPPFSRARYGAVPRHIVFHPSRRYAYVINEMDSTVFVYRWDEGKGTLEPFQRITSTPDDYVGDNMAAEIAILPSGRFLYASNRGPENIVIYAVNPSDGTLKHVGWEPVQGVKPRFFCLSPDATRLFACNQGSDTIVEFLVNQDTGLLKPTGQVIETGAPTCIVFAE